MVIVRVDETRARMLAYPILTILSSINQSLPIATGISPIPLRRLIYIIADLMPEKRRDAPEIRYLALTF
jgi:hypothetical protein